MACEVRSAYRPFCYNHIYMVAKVVKRQKQAFCVVWPAVILLIISFTLPAGAVTTIMPVGDSITKGWYGSANRWGYRSWQGPVQDITGKVINGKTYQCSAWV
jgi:hypothetical protein